MKAGVPLGERRGRAELGGLGPVCGGATGKPASRMRILIVDDQRSIRLTSSQAVRAEGHEADTADSGRFVETFLLESWAEHLRQHQRVTNADRLLERNVRQYLSEPAKTTHYIAADRNDRK